MTPPAFVVLTLALVCSTYGTAMEQTADRASEHTMHNKANADNPNTSTKMRAGTNHENYIVNNEVAFIKSNDIENRINNIYTQTGDIANKRVKGNNEIERSRNNMKKRVSMQTNHNVQRINRYNFDETYIENAEYRPNYKENNQLYKEDEEFLDNQVYKRSRSIMIAQKHLNFGNKGRRNFDLNKDINVGRIKRQIVDPNDKCDEFMRGQLSVSEPLYIYHPHNTTDYYSDIECVRVLNASIGHIITLTFIDVFHIEDHPKCAYDYLEVRDGEYGFSKLLGRLCGDKFPSPIRSTGPVMWLKFKADATIEYEGFTIKAEVIPNSASHKIPDECFIPLGGDFGVVNIEDIPQPCKQETGNHALDVLWKITVKESHAIYLNFTIFDLAKPNECEENLVQIFGSETEEDKALEHYCGSAANAVTTKSEDKPKEKENVMHVRMYLSEKTKSSKVVGNYTAYRTLNPNKDEKCNADEEFDCEDNTCISMNLYCDHYANCRLKADEDPDKCLKVTTTLLQQEHILIILVIFSVILSGMSFVFLFKCIKKLYQDHKAIKEHIGQSTEDRLDTLVTGNLLLDPRNLPEPRASLERENHANELNNKQQRSISQHKGLPQQTSIESDFPDTPLDLDDERGLANWRQDVDVLPEPDDVNVKAERNGRIRRHDTSRKEETLRSRKESVEEKKEIRDAAVGAPDTKESGCQTRESLFQADTALSSDGSNSASNSRGFSTFGYSGATLVRPSPPPAATPAPMISSTQIELLRQLPSLETTHKSQKKHSDRRPMSAETTRSAPDVIIVSKPIR